MGNIEFTIYPTVCHTIYGYHILSSFIHHLRTSSLVSHREDHKLRRKLNLYGCNKSNYFIVANKHDYYLILRTSLTHFHNHLRPVKSTPHKGNLNTAVILRC